APRVVLHTLSAPPVLAALALHDALPILVLADPSRARGDARRPRRSARGPAPRRDPAAGVLRRDAAAALRPRRRAGAALARRPDDRAPGGGGVRGPRRRDAHGPGSPAARGRPRPIPSLG